MAKTIAKKLMLLSMGTMFAIPFLGGMGDLGCVSNANLVDFYQSVGGAAINDLTETAVDTMPAGIGNFQNLVITPTQAFWTSAWNNWITQQFPLDVTAGTVEQ